MRLLKPVVLAAALALPSEAQVPPSIGPSFDTSAINVANFDAVFERNVTLVPAVPLLLGQVDDARYDAIVCNAGASGVGWVKVDPKARWGVLEPGGCTMFASIHQLQLTTPGDNSEWTAKVYLRAKK